MKAVYSLVIAFVLQVAADAAAEVRQIVAHRGASAERPECTLAALRRAIEVGATAVEVDIRTSKDGKLFLLHDATLDRTTNGNGPASERSLAELKKLDAGSWFDAKYRGERIPTLREALELCRARIDVLLDLKEQGATYAEAVAREVRDHGDPNRAILGVRSVQQARQFRRLLPMSRQLALIPDPGQIDAFAKAGVETIRLWPEWLSDDSLVVRIRRLGVRLHLNGATGKPREVLPLLMHEPYSLLVDDPATLVAPRPIHFSNATDDGFGPAEARRCVKRITPLYRKAGGAAPRFSEPPGRHEYAFDPALKFFEKTIGKPE